MQITRRTQEYIDAYNETGSYSKASRKLDISHCAIWMRLNALKKAKLIELKDGKFYVVKK